MTDEMIDWIKETIEAAETVKRLRIALETEPDDCGYVADYLEEASTILMVRALGLKRFVKGEGGYE